MRSRIILIMCCGSDLRNLSTSTACDSRRKMSTSSRAAGSPATIALHRAQPRLCRFATNGKSEKAIAAFEAAQCTNRHEPKRPPSRSRMVWKHAPRSQHGPRLALSRLCPMKSERWRGVHSPSVTSAQRITVLPLRNSITGGSITSGRSRSSTIVATIASHLSLNAIESADLPARTGLATA
jgi:hypothetical protein